MLIVELVTVKFQLTSNGHATVKFHTFNTRFQSIVNELLLTFKNEFHASVKSYGIVNADVIPVTIKPHQNI
ncbi:MAG: hypothetical protein Q8S84_09170 [bacterium]|nr:hypothetical protein [bacterium]